MSCEHGAETDLGASGSASAPRPQGALDELLVPVVRTGPKPHLGRRPLRAPV